MQQQSPIQRIMQTVGNSHRYQMLMIVLFALMWYQLTSILLGNSFIFMNPIFKCSFTEGIVDEIIACPRISECQILNGYTIVGYVQLYCDRQADRSILQSALPVGSIVGLLVMNTVADIKGRKWAILLCTILGFLGMSLTVVGAFLDSLPMMVLAQIMSGFGGYPIMIITYVVLYDVCNDHMRQQGMIIMNIVWGVTEMTFFIFDRWFNEWYLYIIIFNIIPLFALAVATYLFLAESPNYLMEIKRDQQVAIKALDKIADFNRMGEHIKAEARRMVEDYFIELKVLDENGDQIQQQAHSPLNNAVHLFKKLLGKWEYLKPVILLAIIYTAGVLVFYSIQYSLDDVGLDYSDDMLFLGSAEAIAFIILQIVFKKIERMRRVIGMGGLYFIAGILGLLFFIPAVQDSPLVASILVTIIRLLTTLAYAFFAFLQTESFPSDIQSTGAGLIESFSQIGTFVCPFILTALINADIYPLGVISIILIVFSIGPAFFLRETRKAPLKIEKSGRKEKTKKSLKKKKKKSNKKKEKKAKKAKKEAQPIQQEHKESLLSSEVE